MRLDRWQRSAGYIYVAAAIILAGWAVNLGRSLNPEALAHHLPWVKAAMATLLVIVFAALLALDGGADRQPPRSRLVMQMVGLAVITLSITIEWFFLLPRTVTTWGDFAFKGAVALVGSSTAVLLRAHRRPPWRQTVRIVCLGFLASSAVMVVALSPPTVIGTRQPLVWVGLDVAEVLAMAGTGVLLLARRCALIPATIAACLFTCDAIINIGVAGGHALAPALLMACLELPLAGLSAWLGVRSARKASP